MENDPNNKPGRLAVDVSDDRLRAWIRLCRPDDADQLSESDVLAALEEAEIDINPTVREKIGALIPLIRSAEDKSGRYLIAEGRLPVEGQNGVFVRDESLKPNQAALKDDAAVDYHAFNTLITVDRNDPIGRVAPAIPGTSGEDVHGRIMTPAHRVEDVRLHSTVRRADDDPCVVIATVSGKIVFEDGALSIDEAVTIKGDVDFTCGNIDASVDVFIDGTILDQFRVKSKKSIRVGGAILAADVEAGGDILVRGGIIGHHKGRVCAGGRIVAKFVEAANLEAESDVEITKEVMHSSVCCRGRFSVTRGAVIGGEVYARDGAEAASIGSEAFIPTSIIAGVHPNILEKADTILAEMRAKEKTIEGIRERVRPLLLGMKGLKRMHEERANELLVKADRMASEVAMTKAKCEQMVREARSDVSPAILVTKTVYPGVRIRIGHRHVVFGKELKGPVRIEKQTIDGVTEFVAVSQVSGSVTVLSSSRVDDDVLEAPFGDQDEAIATT
jgi:hypothetical protein